MPLPRGAGIQDEGSLFLLGADRSLRVDIAEAVCVFADLVRSGPPPILGVDSGPIVGCRYACAR